jgi:hypothetical protein
VGSGVVVGGSVGSDNSGFVGGKVEVTKRAGVGAGVACETLMQEARLRAVTRVNVQIFFIEIPLRTVYRWGVILLENRRAGARPSHRLSRESKSYGLAKTTT